MGTRTRAREATEREPAAGTEPEPGPPADMDSSQGVTSEQTAHASETSQAEGERPEE
jgi:hypothetical protein